MNKSELIDGLEVRLGDRKVATAALDGFLDIINRAVAKGEKVSITGFGTFEKVNRPARKARNPRTGETVKVKKTSSVKFRPGTGLKSVAAGTTKLGREPRHEPLLPSGVTRLVKPTPQQASVAPSPAKATSKATAKKATAKATAKKATAKAATPVKKAATKSATPARKTPAIKAVAPAKKTAAKKSAPATAAAKKTAAKKSAPAKKTPATKAAAPAKKTATKKATAKR